MIFLRDERDNCQGKADPALLPAGEVGDDVRMQSAAGPRRAGHAPGGRAAAGPGRAGRSPSGPGDVDVPAVRPDPDPGGGRRWHAEFAWLAGEGVLRDVLVEAVGERFTAVTADVPRGS